MYAVIHTGGKQFKVKAGDTLQVELLELGLGDKTSFKEILLVGEGAGVKIGQPFVTSATVGAEVVAIEKGPKVIVYHKKRRKQSDKKTGHRQPYTRLLITEIDNGSGEKSVLSGDDKKKILGNVGFSQGDAWELKEENLEIAEKKAAAPKAAAPKKAATKTAKAAPKKATAKTKK